MRKVITGFPSLEVAEAFADGVWYVNDGAIEDIEVEPRGDGYVVRFEDTDYDDPDIEMPYERNNMGA